MIGCGAKSPAQLINTTCLGAGPPPLAGNGGDGPDGEVVHAGAERRRRGRQRGVRRGLSGGADSVGAPLKHAIEDALFYVECR
jgi:hypothetical protein